MALLVFIATPGWPLLGKCADAVRPARQNDGTLPCSAPLIRCDCWLEWTYNGGIHQFSKRRIRCWYSRGPGIITPRSFIGALTFVAGATLSGTLAWDTSWNTPMEQLPGHIVTLWRPFQYLGWRQVLTWCDALLIAQKMSLQMNTFATCEGLRACYNLRWCWFPDSMIKARQGLFASSIKEPAEVRKCHVPWHHLFCGANEGNHCATPVQVYIHKVKFGWLWCYIWKQISTHWLYVDLSYIEITTIWNHSFRKHDTRLYLFAHTGVLLTQTCIIVHVKGTFASVKSHHHYFTWNIQSNCVEGPRRRIPCLDPTVVSNLDARLEKPSDSRSLLRIIHLHSANHNYLYTHFGRRGEGGALSQHVISPSCKGVVTLHENLSTCGVPSNNMFENIFQNTYDIIDESHKANLSATLQLASAVFVECGPLLAKRTFTVNVRQYMKNSCPKKTTDWSIHSYFPTQTVHLWFYPTQICNYLSNTPYNRLCCTSKHTVNSKHMPTSSATIAAVFVQM